MTLQLKPKSFPNMPLCVVNGLTREGNINDHGETDTNSQLSTDPSSPPSPQLSTPSTSPKAPAQLFPASQSVTLTTSTQLPSSANLTPTPHHDSVSSSATAPTPAPAPPALPALPDPIPSETPSTRRPRSSTSPSLSSSQSYHTTISLSNASYFAQQAGASTIDPRSPSIRRQPASRSSHGIETSSGPPPALSTQRSHTTETTRRHPSPLEIAASRPHARLRSKTETGSDAGARVAQRSIVVEQNRKTFDRTKVPGGRRGGAGEETGGGMATTSWSRKTRVSPEEDDPDRTIRNLPYPVPSSADHDQERTAVRDEAQRRSSHEDLFLNLARSDSMSYDKTEGWIRSERRRVSGRFQRTHPLGVDIPWAT